MLSARRPSTRAALAIVAVLAFVSVGAALVILSQSASAVNIGALQHQVSASQHKVSALSGAVSAYSGRLARLNTSIASLQARIVRIQADLDAKRIQLFKLQVELTAARNRLRQLEAFEARGESLLARQLVNSYETDRPDLVTV